MRQGASVFVFAFGGVLLLLDWPSEVSHIAADDEGVNKTVESWHQLATPRIVSYNDASSARFSASPCRAGPVEDSAPPPRAGFVGVGREHSVVIPVLLAVLVVLPRLRNYSIKVVPICLHVEC